MSARRALVLAAAVGGALVHAPDARASDDDDLASLLSENVVSGASKSAETASDAPATTATLTASDIRRYGIRSLDEAINFLGLGLVTQNPLHSVEIGGRGVLLTGDFGNHVLLVVDGHAMNEAWDGTAYFEQGAAIPMELIDHVELILGAGSVLYGANAMLGVVNVVTKDAASYRGVHVIAEGGLSPTVGAGGAIGSFAPSDLGASGKLALGFGHELALFGHRAEIVGQLEYYAQNGPSFTFAPQVSLSSRTDAAGNALPYQWGPRAIAPGVWGGTASGSYWTRVPAAHVKITVGEVTVLLRGATYTRATPYVNGFNQTSGDFDDPDNAERDRWLQGDVQWRKRISNTLSLFGHVYGDAYDFRQTLYSSEPAGCPTVLAGPCTFVAEGASRWLGLEMQATQDWFADDRLVTMVGVDARLRHVHGATNTVDAPTGGLVSTLGARDVDDLPAAAYLQQRWTPTSWLHLNGGERFDADPRGGSRFSPRLAGVADVGSGAAAKLVYAEAFRAPTFYEEYYATQTQLPGGSGLRSEVVRSLEASLEQRWRGQRLLFGVFRTWWSDMISLELVDAASGTYQYRNSSQIDNWGYNAQFDGSVGDLRYGASLTGATSRRQSSLGENPLPASPSVFGNVRASYDLPGGWPVVGVAAAVVGSRLADRAIDGGFPSTPVAPGSADLRLTFSEHLPGLEALSWRLGVDYVTAAVSPYVAGPNQYYAPGPTAAPATLAPVNRLTAFATLQYDLPVP